MSRPIATVYALRSLLRHRRRSLLSVIGIGVGGAVCLFMISFVRGETEMMMRAAAESGTGHVRIAPRAWLKTRDMHQRLAPAPERLEAVRALPVVAAAAPHTRTEALLGMGTRTAGVIMVGVDPTAEVAVNRLVHAVTVGRYLAGDVPGTCVIGKGVAKRLDADVDDDLMVTASGRDGEMRRAMLTVRGIIATGSRELDASLCHVLIEDVARISGLPGTAEISILVTNPLALDGAADALRPHLGPDDVLVPWQDIIPELASSVEVDETWTRMMVGVVMVVVFLGIASAQLAAVLERRREFAVLAAIGMKGGRLLRVMLVEGLILGLAGAGAALAIGTPFVYYSASKGIDFGAMYGDMDMGISNVLIDPIIYGDLGWWLIPLALGLSLAATVLSSLYPAWYALHTDPASALRVDH